jgi:hypothetical protein
MDHPFFDNRRLFIPYLTVWAMVIVLQAYLLSTFLTLSRQEAVAVSLFVNMLFILLSFLSWYPVRAIYAVYTGTGALFTTWLLFILFLEAVWLSFTLLAMPLFLPEEVVPRQLFMKILPWQAAAGFFMGVITLFVYYLFLSEEKIKEKEMQEAQLKALVRETELQFLKSQLNPHFLFNTLNNLGNMILQRPDEAREILVQLSAYLRNVLEQGKEEITTIRGELEQIRLYLGLEKIRFEERWDYRETVREGCEEMTFPVMILQPLFENAVRYAYYGAHRESIIRFLCEKEEGYVVITLINSYDPAAPVPEGQGIGLRNIRKRLSLIYGRDDLLQIRRKEDTFEVRLRIPQGGTREQRQA